MTNQYARAREGRYARGERNGNARLTDAQVYLIHDLRSYGLGWKAIARRLNLPRSTVQSVGTGRTRQNRVAPGAHH